jgi:Domain of unknown function (DUF4386)
MSSNRQRARLAGWLYLFVVVSGIFSLIYVPSRIQVAGDMAATVANLRASAGLYRLGIATEMVSNVAFLLLPFALYRLLRAVDEKVAVLLVAFGTIIAPLAFVNVGKKLDVLTLLGGADSLKALSSGEIEARVLLLLRSYGDGVRVAELFWGLWLLPFGYLVYKSGFLPKLLGVLLMLGCMGYLIECLGGVLSPAYAQSAVARFVTLPAAVGEIGICLWMVIFGARGSREAMRAVEPLPSSADST